MIITILQTTDPVTPEQKLDLSTEYIIKLLLL